jgi:hypothetical protein
MRNVWVCLGVIALLIGCRDASGPTSRPSFDLSQAQEDSTSAHALNQRLLTRDASTIRLPRAPTESDGRPWRGREYIVGFHGAGEDLRGEDQAVLQAVGAIERYYFYGFRATAVYLDSSAVARLRIAPTVAWIDSADATGSPTWETTSWTFSQHGFSAAQTGGYFGHGDVRVAVIGNGVQCALDDLSCGTGWDVTGEPNVDGGSGHETAVASIIGAEVNNGIGIKGASPSVSLHSVRAAEWNPRAGRYELQCAHLAVALDAAASFGGIDADIVSLNYRWRPQDACGTGVDSALKSAVWGNGAIVVVAAGNDTSSVAYPANHPLTLAVSAMKQSPFKIAPFSNVGPEIDIAAGGVDVKLLDPFGGVYTSWGTSFAAPHVVSALALLYGQKLSEQGCKPDPAEAKAALFDNTQDPDPPILTDWYGAGALDVNAAIGSDWMQIVCLEW